MLNFAGSLLIEGPNGAGKSYMANRICQTRSGCSPVHSTYRFKDRMWFYHFAQMRKALSNSGAPAVIDRLWASEEIYGVVYRGRTSIPHEGRIMQKVLMKSCTVNVVCTLSDEEAVEQIKKHRKEYHSPQFLQKPLEVAQKYRELLHGRSGGPAVTFGDDVSLQGGLMTALPEFSLQYRIGVEGQNLDQFIDHAFEKSCSLAAAQYQPALDPRTHNIAGYLGTATHVLVGDKVNYGRWEKVWPFSIHANSSLFIATAMSRLGLNEKHFMWTNIDCPEQHIEALAEAKPSLKFVALGSKASVGLKKAGLPHSIVPHPAYGLRFMGLDSWSKEFSEAL